MLLEVSYYIILATKIVIPIIAQDPFILILNCTVIKLLPIVIYGLNI